jgi:hypothetical protein
MKLSDERSYPAETKAAQRVVTGRFYHHRIILLPKSSFLLGRRDKERAMESTEYARKLEELDRLFNDPDAPVEPARLWRLLAELARHDRAPPGAIQSTRH